MELSTFGVVLTFAIGLEEEAIRFYTEAAQVTKYSVMKDTFMTFAEEDKKRRATLIKLRQESDVSDSDTAPSRLLLSGLKRSDYLAGPKLSPEMLCTDVLRLGIEAEEKAHKFYHDVASTLNALPSYYSKSLEKLAVGNSNRKKELQVLFDKIQEGRKAKNYCA